MDDMLCLILQQNQAALSKDKDMLQSALSEAMKKQAALTAGYETTIEVQYHSVLHTKSCFSMFQYVLVLNKILE